MTEGPKTFEGRIQAVSPAPFLVTRARGGPIRCHVDEVAIAIPWRIPPTPDRAVTSIRMSAWSARDRAEAAISQERARYRNAYLLLHGHQFGRGASASDVQKALVDDKWTPLTDMAVYSARWLGVERREGEVRTDFAARAIAAARAASRGRGRPSKIEERVFIRELAGSWFRATGAKPQAREGVRGTAPRMRRYASFVDLVRAAAKDVGLGPEIASMVRRAVDEMDFV